MRILGIDPGLDITGYGVIDAKNDAPFVIEAGLIRTSYREPLARRLDIIYSQVSDLIDQTRPGICVVEELYSHYGHPMTAILMGHARGVVLFCCNKKRLKVLGYPSKTVKRSVTGNGNASKLQVARVVNKFLHLKDISRPLDVTDALALCLTHLHHANKNVGVVKL